MAVLSTVRRKALVGASGIAALALAACDSAVSDIQTSPEGPKQNGDPGTSQTASTQTHISPAQVQAKIADVSDQLNQLQATFARIDEAKRTLDGHTQACDALMAVLGPEAYDADSIKLWTEALAINAVTSDEAAARIEAMGCNATSPEDVKKLKTELDGLRAQLDDMKNDVQKAIENHLKNPAEGFSTRIEGPDKYNLVLVVPQDATAEKWDEVSRQLDAFGQLPILGELENLIAKINYQYTKLTGQEQLVCKAAGKAEKAIKNIYGPESAADFRGTLPGSCYTTTPKAGRG